MSKPVVFTRRAQLAEFVREQKRAGQSIGFVPTMGALHPGHGSLLQKSVSENDVTILSIFVNPIQFGANEDFSKYPRTLQNDVDLAETVGVTAVFAPSVQEMYPEGFLTNVNVKRLSDVLCGQFRPGHFDGVCTVVLLLLNLAQPDRAYFGMKDFQQLTIIKRMCTDLAHPTEIVGVPILREQDGLALSSRNQYLDPQARQLARTLSRALAATAKEFLGGERNAENLLQCARKVFESAELEPQYLEIRSTTTLLPIEGEVKEAAVMAVAQNLAVPTGTCRLIDNAVLDTTPFYRELLEDLIARTA